MFAEFMVCALPCELLPVFAVAILPPASCLSGREYDTWGLQMRVTIMLNIVAVVLGFAVLALLWWKLSQSAGVICSALGGS